MKKDKKDANLIHKIEGYFLNTLLKLSILFLLFPLFLNKESKKVLYIKTNGIINEIIIINSSNHIKNIFNNKTNIIVDNYNIFKKEIEAEYGDQIIINLLNNKKDKKLSIGILLQIEKLFYELNDSNFTILSNNEIICNDHIDININDTYIKNILYCYTKNSNESIINILLPFIKYYNHNNRILEEDNNICHSPCLECDGQNLDICISCNNSEQYYLIEGNNTCKKLDEMPNNYYIDYNDNLIKKCHEKCSSCTKGYDNSNNEMNCQSCITGTYFQNSTSTNCITRPEKYYVENGILFPCHKNCLTCDKGGDDNNNNCKSCIDGYFLDDEINTNCLNQKICKFIEGCAKCFKNNNHIRYGMLSIDKMCRECKMDDPDKPYYPLQKYNDAQFYVNCYRKDELPTGYYFDEEEQMHKLCYETCASCNKKGNYFNHSCISCAPNYYFVEEDPNKCFPKCAHYYYFTQYNQYKCTKEDECPKEYPYFIEDKLKCIDHCINDKTYIYLYKKECFYSCPDGTSPVDEEIYGLTFYNCIENITDIECKLEVINNVQSLNKQNIDDILEQYAKEYMKEYPVRNDYVRNYSFPENLNNNYRLIIYKMEECAIETIQNFTSFGISECIQNITKKEKINKKIIVEIFYNYTGLIPKIKINLYNPDTKTKLDISECPLTLSFAPSLFDNKEINEEEILYFYSLNVNLFNKSDPFYTDICFIYSENGKDVPLINRSQYYPNISLCDEKCTFIDIDLNTFNVNCSCDIVSESSNIEKAKEFLNNSLSGEAFGFLEETNLAVLKCFKKAFELEEILKNFGGMTMAGIFLVQIILSIAIKCQAKQVRNYICSLLRELNFPPKKTINRDNNKIKIIESIESSDKSKEIISIKMKSDRNKIKKHTQINLGISLGNKKDNNSFNKEKSKKDNSTFDFNNNNDSNNNSKRLCLSQSGCKYFDDSNYKNDNDIYNKNSGIDESNEKSFRNSILNENKEKNDFNSYFHQKNNLDLINEDSNNEEIRVEDINQYKKKFKKELIAKVKNQLRLERLIEREKERRFIHYEYKNYDEKELNELDFEKAIIYDKRTFCQIFWYILRQKQIIINTFCEKSQLKLFSIKLLVMIFSFTCYFVINGFLYNEDYIIILYGEERNLRQYFTDSIERIIYASLVGGLISFVIGIIFNTDKKIEGAIEKYKKNTILLKGEISKIYKCNNIILVLFIIFHLIIMAFFTFYVFCFCYVYPNSMIDWCESSLIVIGFIQFISFMMCILLSFSKYLSVKCRWELCFNINSYLEENI